MYEVGEIRLFATGIMECVEIPSRLGSCCAVMQSEQRVWDGRCWSRLTDDLSPKLATYYDQQRKERSI